MYGGIRQAKAVKLFFFSESTNVYLWNPPLTLPGSPHPDCHASQLQNIIFVAACAQQVWALQPK
jgi:hypothetical protein